MCRLVLYFWFPGYVREFLECQALEFGAQHFSSAVLRLKNVFKAQSSSIGVHYNVSRCISMITSHQQLAALGCPTPLHSNTRLETVQVRAYGQQRHIKLDLQSPNESQQILQMTKLFNGLLLISLVICPLYKSWWFTKVNTILSVFQST